MLFDHADQAALFLLPALSGRLWLYTVLCSLVRPVVWPQRLRTQILQLGGVLLE